MGILLHAEGVPLPHHFLGSCHIVLRQRLCPVVRVLLEEAVDVVALLLEFPALQVCQVINVVDVVKAVPVNAPQEFAGEPPFQLCPVLPAHVGDPAGNAPLPGIIQNVQNGCFPIAVADGVGVDAPAVEVGEEGHTAVEHGRLLVAPQIQIGKRVFAAPVRTGEQNGFVVRFLLQRQPLKINHGLYTSFVFR